MINLANSLNTLTKVYESLKKGRKEPEHLLKILVLCQFSSRVCMCAVS